VSDLRIGFDPLLLHDELRHIQGQAQVVGQLMRTEIALHGFYLERAETQLRYLARAATAARRREAEAGGGPPPWEQLTSGARETVVTLLHAAAEEGLLGPFGSDAEAWTYFLAEFVPAYPDLLDDASQGDGEAPRAEPFLRAGRIVHRAGWSNAQSFAKHAADLAALTRRVEALRLLAQGGQS
jgi:hypothetical protein